MRNTKAFALLAVAGLCAPALAQDSVSTGPGLPGDALDPYAAGDVCNSYVVDLAPLVTSMGNTFGVAPILKSTKTDPTFFNNLISAQAISPDALTGIDISGNSYDLWENAPGFGIHSTNNTPANTVSGPANTVQLAAGFAEFGGNFNGVTGAMVNYDPANPNRLYVTRRHVAGNGANSADNLAQFGGLSADANGNFYYRCDFFNTSAGTYPAISGNNIFRTRLLDRTCGTLNIISGNLGASSDASDWIVQSSGTIHSPCNNVPASIIGGSGRMAGTNFNMEYVYGAAAPATGTTAHLASAPGGDQRGTMAFSRYNLLGSANAVATHAVLAKDAAGDTNVVEVFTVDAAGAVQNTFGIDFNTPGSISDPIDGFNYAIASFPGEFDHYHDQAAYRGGVSQVAITEDQAGRALAAAVYYDVAAIDFEYNSLIAARWDPANPAGTLEYSVVAYIDIVNGYGKGLMDANGDFIGRLEPLTTLVGHGPSMSAPAFDSAGNAWFIGSVGLFDVAVDDPANGNIVDYDSALIRGIYDPNLFGWRLELVAELGTVIDGPNSGIPYQISFMGIVDSNNISSGTFFSNNANELAFGGGSSAGLEPADTATNGGVVVNLEIVYDSEGDDDFEDPTATGGNALSTDEAYNVLLYVGHYEDNSCPCDLTGEGVLNLDDLDAFIAAFLGGDLAADLNGDGSINLDDLDAFIACFLAGCN